MQIRTLMPADASAYVELRREMLNDSPWAFSSSVGDDVGLDAELVAASLADGRQAIVGAFDDGGRLVGAAGLFKQKHAKMAHRARVWGVYVSPRARGRGVGAGIMRRLIEIARTWSGITSLGLSASEGAPEARRMYRSLGFTTWGVEPAALVTGGKTFSEFHMVLEFEPREAVSVLETERLELRAWREDDSPHAMKLWGDPRVTRFIDSRGRLTEEQVLERLMKEIATRVRHGVQYWAAFEKSSGECVGCGGLRPRDARPLEFGVHLRPEFWGKGYATELGRVVLAYAFDRLGTEEVFAGHHPENRDSRRMLEKLGFRSVGEVHYPPTGLMHPSYLLRKEGFSAAGKPSAAP